MVPGPDGRGVLKQGSHAWWSKDTRQGATEAGGKEGCGTGGMSQVPWKTRGAASSPASLSCQSVGEAATFPSGQSCQRTGVHTLDFNAEHEVPCKGGAQCGSTSPGDRGPALSPAVK